MCPTDGHRLVRVRRTPAQRILFSAVFRCDSCDYQRRALRPALDVNTAFLTSRYTCCVHCGGPRVRPVAARAKLDPLSWHPVSLLFRLTGAPLWICSACRLQYYDWRPVAPGSGRE